MVDGDSLFKESSVSELADIAAKREHDEHRRTQDAAKTAELLQAIHNLQERIYDVRWDANKSFGEKKTAVFVSSSFLSLLFGLTSTESELGAVEGGARARAAEERQSQSLRAESGSGGAGAEEGVHRGQQWAGESQWTQHHLRQRGTAVCAQRPRGAAAR